MALVTRGKITGRFTVRNSVNRVPIKGQPALGFARLGDAKQFARKVIKRETGRAARPGAIKVEQ